MPRPCQAPQPTPLQTQPGPPACLSGLRRRGRTSSASAQGEPRPKLAGRPPRPPARTPHRISERQRVAARVLTKRLRAQSLRGCAAATALEPERVQQQAATSRHHSRLRPAVASETQARVATGGAHALGLELVDLLEREGRLRVCHPHSEPVSRAGKNRSHARRSRCGAMRLAPARRKARGVPRGVLAGWVPSPRRKPGPATGRASQEGRCEETSRATRSCAQGPTGHRPLHAARVGGLSPVPPGGGCWPRACDDAPRCM